MHLAPTVLAFWFSLVLLPLAGGQTPGAPETEKSKSGSDTTTPSDVVSKDAAKPVDDEAAESVDNPAAESVTAPDEDSVSGDKLSPTSLPDESDSSSPILKLLRALNRNAANSSEPVLPAPASTPVPTTFDPEPMSLSEPVGFVPAPVTPLGPKTIPLLGPKTPGLGPKTPGL